MLQSQRMCHAIQQQRLYNCLHFSLMRITNSVPCCSASQSHDMPPPYFEHCAHPLQCPSNAPRPHPHPRAASRSVLSLGYLAVSLHLPDDASTCSPASDTQVVLGERHIPTHCSDDDSLLTLRLHAKLPRIFATDPCITMLARVEGWLREQAEELQVQLQSSIRMLSSSHNYRICSILNSERGKPANQDQGPS